jgi:hypothetical protein
MTATLAGVSSPLELVPGDVAGMHEASERLLVRSWTYDAVAGDLAQVGAVLVWEGAAADSFRAAVGRLPDPLTTAAQAHRRAGYALRGHIETVELARYRAGEALGLWEQAARLTAAARAEHQHARTRVDLVAEHRSPVVFHDPGETLRAEALTTVAAAQRMVAESGDDVAAQVRAAGAEAPPDLGFWDALGGGWSDFWHAATDVGASVGNAVMSFGNALLQNPDILAEIVGGMLLIQGGMAMEGGGVALDATGVGAPAGIAVGVVGVGAIALGAGMVVHGLGRAAAEAAGESAVSPLRGVGRGGGGGSGAGTLDAAGVRSRVAGSTRSGRSPGVRVVDDEAELRSLFDELSAGGADKTPTTGAYANGGGRLVELGDGTRIGWRSTSSSGGPTLDITYPGGRKVKVHVDG